MTTPKRVRFGRNDTLIHYLSGSKTGIVSPMFYDRHLPGLAEVGRDSSPAYKYLQDVTELRVLFVGC